MLAESHNILNRYQLLNVHGINDVRHNTEKHTAEPLVPTPSFFFK
jgi:hypothetical protein